MGKFLLLAVLGSSLVLAQQIYSSQQTENKTAKDQRAYQEEVIAREIATSAFNYGMSELRAHGEDTQSGASQLNGADGQGITQTHTTGRFAGGRHTIRAKMTSGHSVQLIATGEYGSYVDENNETQYRTSFEMHDEYRVPVLIARHRGVVDVRFIEAQAGYCSAVFYQAYTTDMPEGFEPEVKLLFAADNREGLVNRPSQQIIVEPGTQMNFFIGVDQNCSERINESNVCEARETIREYRFDPSDFNYIHYALELEAGRLDQAEESVWGFVEQSGVERNRWRIGWEDIHNTSWDNPNSDNPANSLQATKAYGYDVETGWETDGEYRLLKDYGGRPDFSDQVIEISVFPLGSAAANTRIAQEAATAATCGETIDPEPGPEPEPQPEPGPEPEVEPEPGPEPEPQPEPEPEVEADGADCTCQGNKKVYVFHRPPGNEHNPQRICIGESAVPAHLRNHNDYVICTGLDKQKGKK